MTSPALNFVLYLLPALLIALVIRYFSRRMLVAWFLRLPGNVIHEVAHFLAGFCTFAGPVGISFIPHRSGPGQWTLGSASFRNLCWYNAAIVCLAPLMCLPLCAWLVLWRLKGVHTLTAMDPVYWYVAANLLLSAWPSPQDMRQSLRSWPIFVLLLVGLWVYYPLIADRAMQALKLGR